MDKSKKTWLDIIYNRGTATYRNGKLDFTHGEGGNNHIHCYDADGNEIGYVWFDTHTPIYGFCGKSIGSCRGVFQDACRSIDPVEWMKSSSVFQFTEHTFNRMMEYVLGRIR